MPEREREKEESVRLHVPSIPQALAYLEGEHTTGIATALQESVRDRALFRTQHHSLEENHSFRCDFTFLTINTLTTSISGAHQ